MPQTIARPSTCFACLVPRNVTGSLIRVVLEVLSQELTLRIAEQCPAARVRQRRTVEKLRWSLHGSLVASRKPAGRSDSGSARQNLAITQAVVHGTLRAI